MKPAVSSTPYHKGSFERDKAQNDHMLRFAALQEGTLLNTHRQKVQPLPESEPLRVNHAAPPLTGGREPAVPSADLSRDTEVQERSVAFASAAKQRVETFFQGLLQARDAVPSLRQVEEEPDDRHRLEAFVVASRQRFQQQRCKVKFDSNLGAAARLGLFDADVEATDPTEMVEPLPPTEHEIRRLGVELGVLHDDGSWAPACECRPHLDRIQNHARLHERKVAQVRAATAFRNQIDQMVASAAALAEDTEKAETARRADVADMRRREQELQLRLCSHRHLIERLRDRLRAARGQRRALSVAGDDDMTCDLGPVPDVPALRGPDTPLAASARRPAHSTHPLRETRRARCLRASLGALERLLMAQCDVDAGVPHTASTREAACQASDSASGSEVVGVEGRLAALSVPASFDQGDRDGAEPDGAWPEGAAGMASVAADLRSVLGAAVGELERHRSGLASRCAAALRPHGTALGDVEPFFAAAAEGARSAIECLVQDYRRVLARFADEVATVTQRCDAEDRALDVACAAPRTAASDSCLGEEHRHSKRRVSMPDNFHEAPDVRALVPRDPSPRGPRSDEPEAAAGSAGCEPQPDKHTPPTPPEHTEQACSREPTPTLNAVGVGVAASAASTADGALSDPAAGGASSPAPRPGPASNRSCSGDYALALQHRLRALEPSSTFGSAGRVSLSSSNGCSLHEAHDPSDDDPMAVCVSVPGGPRRRGTVEDVLAAAVQKQWASRGLEAEVDLARSGGGTSNKGLAQAPDRAPAPGPSPTALLLLPDARVPRSTVRRVERVTMAVVREAPPTVWVRDACTGRTPRPSPSSSPHHSRHVLPPRRSVGVQRCDETQDVGTTTAQLPEALVAEPTGARTTWVCMVSPLEHVTTRAAACGTDATGTVAVTQHVGEGPRTTSPGCTAVGQRWLPDAALTSIRHRSGHDAAPTVTPLDSAVDRRSGEDSGDLDAALGLHRALSAALGELLKRVRLRSAVIDARLFDRRPELCAAEVIGYDTAVLCRVAEFLHSDSKHIRSGIAASLERAAARKRLLRLSRARAEVAATQPRAQAFFERQERRTTELIESMGEKRRSLATLRAQALQAFAVPQPPDPSLVRRNDSPPSAARPPLGPLRGPPPRPAASVPSFGPAPAQASFPQPTPAPVGRLTANETVASLLGWRRAPARPPARAFPGSEGLQGHAAVLTSPPRPHPRSQPRRR